MKALLLTSTLLISLPVQAAIWPFTDRCDDIDEIVANGELPSMDDASFYVKECGGEKLESLGDAASDTASDAKDKAADLWESLKDKVSE